MKLKIILVVAQLVLFSPLCFADTSTAQLWQNVECNVRDGKISKDIAKKEIFELNSRLKQHLSFLDLEAAAFNEWIFPVSGTETQKIDKKGFIEKGYNFFDGNKHGGHPAYDIFIKDKNFDMLDDRTKKPVQIRSISSGIIISVNTGWKPKSKIRGGNYIYIYDDVSNYIFYYAHLDKIFYRTGQLVRAGDVIATMGRSGKNAYPRRSPTHLHLMALDAQTMQPIDILKRFKTK